MTVIEKPYVVFGYGSLIFKVSTSLFALYRRLHSTTTILQPPPHVIAQGSSAFSLLTKRFVRFVYAEEAPL